METYQVWTNYQSLSAYCAANLNSRDLYEIRNIIERFVISERQATPDTYPAILEKMKGEIAEKHLAEKWYGIILQHLGIQDAAAKPPSVVGNRFTYGKCTFTLDQKRLGAISAYPDYNPMDVVRLYMDYNIGVNGSNQWSILPSFYARAHDALKDTHTVIEGCASLFNSNMLVIKSAGDKSTKPEPAYCSLQPLETRYGSLGRLDTVLPWVKTISDRPVFWIVNPPFVESIMIHLGHLLLEHAEHFFWIMPYWSDSKAFTQFADVARERGLTMKILRKKTYKYTNGNQDILASFDSVIFTTNPKLVDMV